jgi:[ribosomal protein S5]-alanine N-acetyltransferase
MGSTGAKRVGNIGLRPMSRVDGVITTERLELRPFTVESATATASGEQADLAWAAGFPRDDDRDAARMFLQAPHEVFGGRFIIDTRAGVAVGTIGFLGPPDPDGVLTVGYGLVPQARGQGYATEALRALVEYALVQPGVVRVVADTDVSNVASHRVLEKAGFRRTHSTQDVHWYARTAEPA